MSDVAVRARNLTKSYTLYPTPWSRMREIIGFKRPRDAGYAEHIAVDGIDLDIRFGEKVAFIGRNGAGKSTLLKLITGVIEPSRGSLEINGETHALLQMGAGFHTDFTGRENARGYLANLGVAGSEADRLIDGIIEFAELEEYIDQPLKTYSTGMQMRLIFAASTTIAPKLFVIDEVLGVGDAYFQQKSFSRIKELCEKNRTTLLLVSHDIYTAAKICDRMVWIDRGRIKFDGSPRKALDLYEASIRQQEEDRLRKKNLQSGIVADTGNEERLLLELRPAANTWTDNSLYFSNIELVLDGKPASRFAFEETDVTEFRHAEDSSWGDVLTIDGRKALELQNTGSVFNKGTCLFSLPHRPAASALAIRAEVYSEHATTLESAIYCGDEWLATDPVSLEANHWTRIEIHGLGEWRSLADQPVDVPTSYGTGTIQIRGARLVGRDGAADVIFKHGTQLQLVIEFKASARVASEIDVILAIHKEGADCVCRSVARNLKLSLDDRGNGKIRVDVPYLRLVDGDYTVTFVFAKANYLETGNRKFISINPDVYLCCVKCLEFRVFGSPPEAAGATFILDTEWHVDSSLALE